MRRARAVSRVTALVLAAIVLFCVAAISGCGSYVRLRVKYHLVYCYAPSENRPSAELCAAVKNIGYAGYAVEYGGMYYVAAAIEGTAGAAADLADSLHERGTESGALALERINFELETYHAEQNARQYESTLRSLDGIVEDLCGCVQKLLLGYREEVRPLLREINGELGELAAANPFNCFTAKLACLANLSAECAYGALLPRDVRCLAVAVADYIISVRLT